jgi:hypothetical protein
MAGTIHGACSQSHHQRLYAQKAIYPEGIIGLSLGFQPQVSIKNTVRPERAADRNCRTVRTRIRSTKPAKRLFSAPSGR